jgi:AAA domain-containing protein
MSLLPFQRASELSAEAQQTPWLIEGLWADQAVGILGGEPKCYKSFLALDIAVSVAAGSPCLRQLAVKRPGPVLFFPAEDSLSIVRRRLDGICLAAGLSLDPLPLHVITAPSLRLDLVSDRLRLSRTVQALKPVLLILDPLIRLHQVDENDASQIAPILAYLRQLQRKFQLGVLVVHHAKKDAHGQRPGQALRGSSELHGWGDSNLYMRRRREQLTLSTEHRAAPSKDNIAVELKQSGEDLSLALLGPITGSEVPASTASAPLGPCERIGQILASLDQAISLRQLRKRCGMRMTTVRDYLDQMLAAGKVVRDGEGYRWAKAPGGQGGVSQDQLL